MKPQPPISKRRRGQTMVEFALTLPLTLLVTFGIVEFARLFQSWLTIQNSARAAVRYGVTGNWEPEDIQTFTFNTFQLSEVAEDELLLDAWVPCYSNRPDEFGFISPDTNKQGVDSFLEHWGLNCNPELPDHLGLREDMARLTSIAVQAEKVATGIPVDMDYNMPGHGAFSNQARTSPDNRARWFHVMICSTRPALFDSRVTNRYTIDRDGGAVDTDGNGIGDTPARSCVMVEDTHDPAQSWFTNFNGPARYTNQYDAGGPGDLLEVIVHYNAPMITPVAGLAGLLDMVTNTETGEQFIHLVARRTGLNETFRNTRAVNLPPQLDLLTATPTNTAVPSATSSRTNTPAPTTTETKTETPTSTETASPTTSPECSELFINPGGISFSGPWLRATINNGNAGPVSITAANIAFRQYITGSMYAAEARIVGKASHWIAPGAIGDGGRDYRVSPVQIDNSLASWINGDPSLVELPGVGPYGGNVATTWQIRFANGPVDLSAGGYTVYDFAGSWIQVSWPNPSGGTVNCQVPFPVLDSTLTYTPENPTNTPTPDCSLFELTFDSFDGGGVVVFRLANIGPQPARIIGIELQWDKSVWRDTNNIPVNPVVDRMEIGPYQLGDPLNTSVWDGNDNVPPTIALQTGGEPTWLVTPVIDRGMILNLFVDFDNLGGPYPLDYYYAHGSHFAGTRVLFEGCGTGLGEIPPPVATGTRAPTDTLRPTNTNRPSNTPGPSPTASNTVPTNTPTSTFTPSNTPTTPPFTDTATLDLGGGWDG